MDEEQIKAIDCYVNSSTEKLTIEEKEKILQLEPNSFAFQLNSLLRANLNLNKTTNNLVQNLSNSFQGFTTHRPIKVYRACNYLEMIRYIDAGYYLEKGFMSTSKNVVNIHRFFQEINVGYFPAFVEINIPAGFEILDLDNVENFQNNTMEEEILLNRNALFKINNNERKPSTGMEVQIGKENVMDYNEIYHLEITLNKYLPL